MSARLRLIFRLVLAIPAIAGLAHSDIADAQGTGAQINESAISQVVYVDQSNSVASDQNPGTISQPFLTIGRAISVAALNVNGGTKIEIGPGTYRETINLSGFSSSDQAPLILEATDPGEAVISGSDLWTGWQSQDDGTYTLPWPYRWGNAPSPSGWPALQPIVTRREMVFVNNVAMQQVLSLPLPGPGTFNVVDGGTITLWPPIGTDMTTAAVDVSTRAGLLQTPRGISNLVLRGLEFVHDNTAVNSIGNAAVKLTGGSNILVDSCVFDYNNWLGLSVSGGPAQAITIQNSLADHNGENGIALAKLDNLLFNNNQTSSNNWRGAAGGFITFDADGMKVSRIHDATFSNSVSAYNLTGGAWFDTDNANVVIQNLQFCGNLTNGLFIEASEGPVTVTGGQFFGNNANGLQLANSTAITMTDSVLYGNAKGIFVGGSDSPRSVTNYATGQNYSLYQQNLTLNDNDLVGTSSSQYFLTSSLSGSWTLFVQTLSSDYNDYYNRSNVAGFSTKFGRQNLGGWQSSSKQDPNSVTTSPGIVVPSYCGTPD
jgi:hypothetical protein